MAFNANLVRLGLGGVHEAVLVTPGGVADEAGEFFIFIWDGRTYLKFLFYIISRDSYELR